ncbi:MAG: mannose-1-phosphate guanylyltransferase [Syntrophus sp. (in: bacteria)]|nr:mannose-1-phosphate guanylyltransferase [Syntrophus sp. (in: bacteria)]
MAGGKGERFWPLSTGNAPKPFLQLTGEKTLIQLTVERAARFVPKKRIFIVLGKKHLKVAQKQLPDLPRDNFIVEPAGRDTAACIGLAAITLLLRDDKATMVILPADQYVPDVDKFADTMRHCVALAQKDDSLITMGITPTRPETGYGYIKAGKKISSFDDAVCFAVDAYVEKPDLKKATEYIKDGNYYWNAGIFIWQVKTILKGLEQHMPNLYKGLLAIEDALREGKKTKADTIFKDFERKSIDYGLMEKARNVLMVPAIFKWDDVGTWASLQRVLDLDKEGNYKQGSTICIDTKDSVVVGGNTVIATIGVSNLVIIASKKGILICSKDRVQDVREIVKSMEAKQR